MMETGQQSGASIRSDFLIYFMSNVYRFINSGPDERNPDFNASSDYIKFNRDVVYILHIFLFATFGNNITSIIFVTSLVIGGIIQ